MNYSSLFFLKKSPLLKKRAFGSEEFEKEHKSRKNDQKCKIEKGEHSHVIACFSRIVLHVLAEGNKARQRGDEGSHTADVDANQKIGIVLRELGKQNGRGNVTDALTGKNAEKERTFIKKHREQISDCIDPCHIPRKDKKEYEGEKQTVVHHFQCFPIHDQKNGGNDDKADPIRDAAEYDHDGKGKEKKIQDGSLGIQIDLFIVKI